MDQKPDLETEFRTALASWKAKRGLRDDDPVLLCVELFRIHQKHWDELRRRDLPSFEQFRGDIQSLTQTSSAFCSDAAALAGLLKTHRDALSRAISPSTAIFSVTLALVAGMILGKVLF